MTVTQATTNDVAPLARVLAQAFDDDPVWRWTVPPGANRLQRLERFFALELEHVALPKGTVWATADNEGAALIMPPDKWRVPIATQARHAPQLRARVRPAAAARARAAHSRWRRAT